MNYDPLLAQELWKSFEQILVRNGSVNVDEKYMLPWIGPGMAQEVVKVGLYHHHLSRWLQHFPRSQVRLTSAVSL